MPPETPIAVPAEVLLAWTHASEGAETEARRTRELLEQHMRDVAPILEEYVSETRARREERSRANASRLEARSSLATLLGSKQAFAFYALVLAALSGWIGTHFPALQAGVP